MPSRTTDSGKALGGRPFTRGQLYLILKRVTYTGRIGHRDQIHAGLHPAIIDIDTFDKVQALLASNCQSNEARIRAASPSLLAGRIVDASDQPLIATHATKGKARYRYYVSRDLHHGNSQQGLRIPAREIERLVWDRIVTLFSDPIDLIATAWLEVRPDQLPSLHTACEEIASTSGVLRRRVVAALIDSVRVADDRIEIAYRTAGIASLLATRCHPDAPTTITHRTEASLARAGRAVRLIHGSDQPSSAPSASLSGLLIQARDWWNELRKGEVDISTLTAREGVTSSWITRVVRLAFLSPEVVTAILGGRQPADLDAKSLTLDRVIEPNWALQRGWLG